MENLSAATQVIIALIPVVGITMAAILIFFAMLWKHSENKLAIKNNTYRPTEFNLKAFSLLAGLCLLGVGGVISALFIIIEPVSWNILGGLIPFIIGFMMIIFFKINFKSEK